MPKRMRSRKTASVLLAGPTVQTILALRRLWALAWMDWESNWFIVGYEGTGATHQFIAFRGCLAGPRLGLSPAFGVFRGGGLPGLPAVGPASLTDHNRLP